MIRNRSAKEQGEEVIIGDLPKLRMMLEDCEVMAGACAVKGAP